MNPKFNVVEPTGTMFELVSFLREASVQAPGKKYNSASAGEAFRAGETLIFTLSPAPSRRLRGPLPRAFQRLQEASRRPQRGLKMAHDGP